MTYTLGYWLLLLNGEPPPPPTQDVLPGYCRMGAALYM